MEELKNDGDDGDGDGVQPVVIVQQRPCYIDRVPDGLCKRLALFLAWRDAASLYAGSRAIRTLVLGKWSPHLTVAAECAVLAAAASADNSWRQLGWDSKNRSASPHSSSRPARTAPRSCSESFCHTKAFAVRGAAWRSERHA